MIGKKNPSKSPRETNGPVVKTGPTAGNNRSRNNDGTWHKKRSDAGQPREKKSGCFLTTAACVFQNLPDDCHELETLRRFRDDFLSQSASGRKLVEEYYEVAPAIADRLTGQADLQSVWRVVQQCVADIEAGQPDAATDRYVALVRALEQRLLGA